MTWWSTNKKPRKAIGEARKTQNRVEEGFYPTFEKMVLAFGGWPWHLTVAQRSQPGRPDYSIYFDGSYAEVELKARNPATNRVGKLTAEQITWGERAKRAGVDWQHFTLPDDWERVEKWLEQKTGRRVIR